MAHSCDRILPLLTLAAEGEVDPEQALAIGRHIEDCTACRIRLARERRLARIVGGLDDPIDVDESFLRRVMDELPDRPPRRRPQRGRRGLKLAGLALLAGLAGSSTLGAIGASRAWPAVTDSVSWSMGDGVTGLAYGIGDVISRTGSLVASALLDGTPAMRLETPLLAGGRVIAVATVAACAIITASMLLLAGARVARELEDRRERR